MEQAQPPGPHPPHPAPAMELTSPFALLERAANTDSSRLEPPAQSGQGASSSMRLMGRSRSNRVWQVWQEYSYMGMGVSLTKGPLARGDGPRRSVQAALLETNSMASGANGQCGDTYR